MKRKILLILIILTVAFIWGQSFVPREQSAIESEAVANSIFRPIVEFIFGEGVKISGTLVRKLAHGFEFCVLGIELLLYVPTRKNVLQSSAVAFGFGAGVACIDEFIQIFNDRGPSIVDVGIDCLGVIVGVLISVFISFLINRRKNKRLE